MRVLWTSPHCRPDWLDRLGEESQGGQSVVMNKLPHALTRADPGIHIDIFTRLQDSDPHAANPVKFLDGDPRVRLVRLPCGPTDRYVPKESLYGEPIAEFVEHILAYSGRDGLHYDLLHGHYADGWEVVTSLKARWPHHPLTLLTTHSLGRRKRRDALERGEGTPEELDHRYNFPVRIASEERSLAAADRILPLSTPEAEFLATHYEAIPPGDSRVTVIPNGIDPADFPLAPPGTRFRIRSSLGVADSEFLLVVPSPVDPRKGQENILRALVEARPALAGYPFRLLLMAWPEPPTDYAIRLRRFIAEQGLADYVLAHPPVPHEHMPGYFAAADGIALPSQEYFSIVMLEAMLLGCPLIASIHGGSRDVITDGVNGFLVDHNDVAQLAQAVVRLAEMDETARRDMGRRARQTILGGYNLDQIARRLLTIYRETTIAPQPTWTARRYFLVLSHSAKPVARVGDIVRLSLRFTPEYPGSNSTRMEVPQGEISFFIQAEGFYIQEGEDVITLSLPAQGKEEVETTVELQARLPGARQITIEPFYDGQRHPPLSIQVSVRFDKDVERPELPSPLTLRPVPQPDLCLRVYTFPLNPEASRLRLEYVLYSPLYQLHLPSVRVGSVEVSAAELARLRAQLDRLLRRAFPIGSEELYEGLRSVGRELYTLLFSPKLKDNYREAWDKVGSWLVLCDADPWIPWELVKPHGQKWEHDFLAARYSLGRWVEGWGVSRQAEFPLGAVYFAPDAGLAGHRAREEWTQLVANGDVPRMEESLLVDWPGGYPSALSFSSPVWGLHFESYPERLSPALRGLVAQDTEQFSSEEVAERRLDLRQKRPVVTFGMLALERQTALTEVEARWMPTFVQSGASAFIGPLWATAPQADRIFWRAFYQALWERVPLGEAMLTARRSLRQALPDSLDWLAYFMVGDPMARGYIPRPGEGYVALECRNHDLTQPMQMDKTYSFVASLRATPPPWYTGRLYQTQEEALDDPQVFVFAPGFKVPQALLPVDMRLGAMGSVQFDLVPKIAGEHDIFVKFLAGEEVRQSLTLHVDVESKREEQG